uniref:Uncharacterized protein n=1 Tax=Arundo donax TaxID=35708 RepID=A0A0A9Q476_ARUDO
MRKPLPSAAASATPITASVPAFQIDPVSTYKVYAHS